MLRRFLARLGLALFGVVLGLAALELVLQVAAPLLRPALRPLAEPGIGGQRGQVRVLCVGDSHTYGIWVEPGDTYPARLQRKVARWPRQVVVLNSGVPGMNSSQVAQTFPEMLDRFQPDIALVMVGVADFWNLDSFRASEYGGWRWFLWGGGWWDQSRVVKLARLIRASMLYGREPLPAEVPLVERRPHSWKIHAGTADMNVGISMHFDDGIRDSLVFRRLLRRDLSLITATAQARGVHLILMTYSTEGGLYGAVNEVYRQFAASSGLPLIDLAAQMSLWSRPQLVEKAFFPDFHPRRVGYEMASRIVARELRPLILRASATNPAPAAPAD